MAAKTERHGEILGSAEIAGCSEQDRVLHITVNLLNVMPIKVMPTREVQIGHKQSEAVSHYWMNSLPFVKQTS
jgi:hypothetical protein